MEFAAALKLHVAQCLEDEKRQKVKESKAAICEIIANEFPAHVQFLASASAESREQIVQQVAQRHAVVAKRLEELKSQKSSGPSVAGVSQELAALMQGTDSAGSSLLDSFSKLREQLVGNRAVGKELMSDMARIASITGRYAVEQLDRSQLPPSPEAEALECAISKPQALATGSEIAALELLTNTRERGVVRSALQAYKAAQALLGDSGDCSPMIVDIFLRHQAAAAKPVRAAAMRDTLGSFPPSCSVLTLRGLRARPTGPLWNEQPTVGDRVDGRRCGPRGGDRQPYSRCGSTIG